MADDTSTLDAIAAGAKKRYASWDARCWRRFAEGPAYRVGERLQAKGLQKLGLGASKADREKILKRVHCCPV